jgi:hypothetical protein
MTTTLETGQLDTESEQTPRQRARYEIETYVQDAELEDPRVQALADFSDLCSAQFPNRGIKDVYSVDHIQETIRKRKNGMRGYIRAYDEVTQLAGALHAAVFEETTDSDQIVSIDAKFAAELQEIKNNVILVKSPSPKK